MKDRTATLVAGPPDAAPPQAASTGFLLLPRAERNTAVVMSAPRGTDESEWVEYQFTCTTTGRDCGWIKTPSWQTPPLPDGKYEYAFKMRDTSP